MAKEQASFVRRPPIRVGIAGLGRAALLHHEPALKALPDLYEVVAVCDLMKDRRDLVEVDYLDVHTYRLLEDMIDDPDIDLMLVTLPTRDHKAFAMEALRRNLWTVVESPLVTSHDDAKILQAASVRARNRLVASTPGLFSPEFRLTQAALADPRLGSIFEVRIRVQDYLRRDDWQSLLRCQGGCAWFEGQEAVLQAVALMHAQPNQLWSETKRLVSLGDTEDFARIILKSRGDITVDIEICGGHLPPVEPLFTVRGTRGVFTVQAGATEGNYHVVDPDFTFPRRRASVRTPPLEDAHEAIPVVDIPAKLEGTCDNAYLTFWRTLANTIRTAAPFPVELDSVVETIRYLQLVHHAPAVGKK